MNKKAEIKLKSWELIVIGIITIIILIIGIYALGKMFGYFALSP